MRKHSLIGDIASHEPFWIIEKNLTESLYDVNEGDEYKESPLINAIDYIDSKRHELVKMLIDSGADVYKKTDDNWCAFHFAMCRYNIDIKTVKLITEATIGNVADKREAILSLSKDVGWDEFDLLWQAFCVEDDEVFSFLISEYKLDPNVKNKEDGKNLLLSYCDNYIYETHIDENDTIISRINVKAMKKKIKLTFEHNINSYEKNIYGKNVISFIRAGEPALSPELNNNPKYLDDVKEQLIECIEECRAEVLVNKTISIEQTFSY